MVLSDDPRMVGGRWPAGRGVTRLMSPLTDFQAALGLAQLRRYRAFLARRAQIARRYFESLPNEFTAQLRARSADSIYFRFPLYAERLNAEGAIAALQARGIAARRGVDALLHRQRGLSDRGFPSAVRLFERTVSIPLHPSLSEAEQRRVVAATNAVLESRASR